MRQQLYFGGVTAMVLVIAACSQAAQQRQSSVGEALSTSNSGGSNANGSGSTGNAAGTGSANALPNTGSGGAGGSGTVDPDTTVGNTAGTIGGTTGSGVAAAPVGSKTLEQCQAANQSWRAVVAGGTQPNDCVDTLVSWCCTRDEVKSHFPTMAAELELRFQKFIDTDGEVLYACSVDAKNAYSFSLAKIVGGATTYDVITVSGAVPTVPAQSTPASSNACVKPTTASLVKMSLNLNSLSE